METPPPRRAPAEQAEWTVLLIGNYPPDGQRSMRRFTEMLAAGLRELGLRVDLYHPPVCFGRLGARPQGLGKWIGYLDKYLLTPLHLRARLRRMRGPFVAHIIDHSNAPYVSALQGVPHLVTCHDLLAVRSALGEIERNRPGFTGRRQQAMILRGLKRSRHIVSVSGATRDDVRRLVGGGARFTQVIPNAIEPIFEQAAAGEAPPAPPLGEVIALPGGARYLLHVGGEKWYKNRVGVLRIFRELAAEDPDLHLVAVGPEFSAPQLESSGTAPFGRRIHCLQGVSDLELLSLYGSARLLLFPSWIEGFGWPIVEAQACGCPVFTLDVAPMNELNATPELIFGADTDAESWPPAAAQQCRPYLDLDPAARRALAARLRDFAKRFGNEHSARAYRARYQAILDEHTARS
ncbi:MAG: glycosyltransferase family 4 protein [Opitutales bacterium]